MFEKIKQLLNEPWSTGDKPIEVKRAIVSEITSKTQSIGDGERVFPYSSVLVVLYPKSQEMEDTLLYTLEKAWDLKGEVFEELTEQHAQFPPDLEVTTRVSRSPHPEPELGKMYTISVSREASTEPIEAAIVAEQLSIELTVVEGKAGQKSYLFKDKLRINLGRLDKVQHADGRLLRVNDVAFKDTGKQGEAVSREHGYIAYQAEGRFYTLHDQQSKGGTTIHRQGKPISVTSRDARGQRLQDGDEILLGRALLKVRIR
ncbi:MAG: FHA domain-containing protein [Candidatus Eisenbacteria bacterium]|uniref:FHA domain-containing protein n=1 Tax=Eiseniibacteriota bacterium TaxID=2212470 RepID=A0A7Y2H363_UNCEI|nr:FHA domain-containing protein [Candidatus Eisenbacteria bacterium]